MRIRPLPASKLVFATRPARRILLAGATLGLLLAQCSAADEGFTHTPRGTVGYFELGNNAQIVEWIGPESVKAPVPLIALDEETVLSLRVVPDGMSRVREVARGAPVFGLVLAGVNVSDDDLGYLAEACGGLEMLALIRSSSLPPEELADLTAAERAALEKNTLSAEGLRKISQFAGLKCLIIDGYDLPTDGLAFVSQLKQLDTLRLRHTNVADVDLCALKELPRLERLDLSDNQIDGRGLHELENCRELKELVLNDTKVTDSLGEQLKGHRPPELRELNVTGCAITDAGMQQLRRSLSFVFVITTEKKSKLVRPKHAESAHVVRRYRGAYAALTEFNAAAFQFEQDRPTNAMIAPSLTTKSAIAFALSHLAEIDDLKGIKMSGCNLAGAPLEKLTGMSQLQDLWLDGAQLGDGEMQNLARMKGLVRLDVSQTKISNAGVEMLTNPALNGVVLDDTAVTDRGVAALVKLPSMRFISLRNCNMTDEGAKAISNAKQMELIVLDGTRVTDVGVTAIATLPNLRGISLKNCAVTDVGIRHVLEAPNLEPGQLWQDTLSSDVVGAGAELYEDVSRQLYEDVSKHLQEMPALISVPKPESPPPK